MTFDEWWAGSRHFVPMSAKEHTRTGWSAARAADTALLRAAREALQIMLDEYPLHKPGCNLVARRDCNCFRKQVDAALARLKERLGE